MKGFKLAIVFGLAANSCLFAGTMANNPAKAQTVLGLSIGPSWSNPNNAQTTFLHSDFAQTFSAFRQIENLVSGELFLGRQTDLTTRFQLQLGLALAATSRVRQNGDILLETVSGTDPFNFLYSYNINHYHAALKGKLLPNINRSIQSYLSASLGLGCNRASDYSSTLREVPFSSHTNTSFTYTLGVGLQKTFYSHYAVGIGYEFADWGKSKLLGSATQRRGDLLLNHLYTHQLQFSLTYIGTIV